MLEDLKGQAGPLTITWIHPGHHTMPPSASSRSSLQLHRVPRSADSVLHTVQSNQTAERDAPAQGHTLDTGIPGRAAVQPVPPEAGHDVLKCRSVLWFLCPAVLHQPNVRIQAAESGGAWPRQLFKRRHLRPGGKQVGWIRCAWSTQAKLAYRQQAGATVSGVGVQANRRHSILHLSPHRPPRMI